MDSNSQDRLFYDPNTLSNFNRYRIVHTSFNLIVDFNKQIVDGYVDLNIRKVSQDKYSVSSSIRNIKDIPHLGQNSNELILDTRHLQIKRVEQIIDVKTNIELQYSLGTEHKALGQPLHIQLAQEQRDKEEIKTRIYYSTTDRCLALQWMKAKQTSFKQYPYMYSQCQAIHARSFYPCQDTPGIKSTYDASIQVEKPLVVLMSAPIDRIDEKENIYYFKQEIPISSYLVAIVSGFLKSKDLGKRCRVWTEPDQLEKCEYEFKSTELLLSKAEELLGDYVWKRYDFLVLPPSFPYGGMENPTMNFISPTLLAGDRSLISTIVHEITHSWTGNLVTNENWEHFWLNEGLTSFIEAKLLGLLNLKADGERNLKINGNDIRRFHSAQQMNDLKETIEIVWGVEHKYTALVYKLEDVDPDDAYSTVQYYKGAAFLWYLEEQIVGSDEKFNEFLRSYIKTFQYKILNSNDFKEYFVNYFHDLPTINQIDWDKWLYGVGMPPFQTNFHTTIEEQCLKLAEKTKRGEFDRETVDQMSAKQIQYFLNLLLLTKTNTTFDIDSMNKIYDMKRYTNCEIKYRWYQLCIRAKYEPVLEDIFHFLQENGRMKYVKPLYMEFKQSWPDMLPKVIDFFQKNKEYMHVITVNQIELRLGSK
ncbi:unnamed protein product [Didymodactylos carnosus]|uniref:Peptidase M1 leukotriene A4 hydrolase/aminopeptidase C-terminal domain-containing protein n=1 Tax=Didymodactylos carnosus TaxID=1234261 RepID=A0A814FUI9_9BILA|nr:unnamed protein product [Didymodactylos carnosus]CAF1023614.1 unnamed protein product [Didymodactylos carnosus]CAF3758302.1 unnamed protein product [Didymodactylos carnosus]CAF3792114.1 unnamed protein product [Didymodactylos carnosus]